MKLSGGLRYKLSLRDLAEMFLIRGIVFRYEVVRDGEGRLTPALAENLAAPADAFCPLRWQTTEAGPSA